MYEFYAIINNVEQVDEPRLTINSPTTLTPIGSVSALSPQKIDEAYEAAWKAQPGWNELGLEQRISYLERWARLLTAHREAIAQLMVAEVAKNYLASLNEIDRSVQYIDDTIKAARDYTPLIMNPSIHKEGIFTRVAKGVGLAISPFNYPVNLAITKIAPILITGNTLIFKPATAGSLTGSYLGKLAVEAGFPAGVFNVVTGKGSEIGDLITQHKHLDFISFTGSAPVGKHILDVASTKDVVLELGGKDPALILDATNLKRIAREIVVGAFSYSGQRCTAIKRVLTTDAIADQLVPLIANEMKQLKVGKPEDNADITPVIDEKAALFVQGLIDDAIEYDGKIILGNKRERNLIWPTLVDHVSLKSRLAWEEPFGPVLPIIRLKDVDEMIQVANDSEYGLQASVFSQDVDQALKVADRLDDGTVNINGKSQRGPDEFPFLGVKASGFGAGGITEALKAATRIKGTVINRE